ncbi:type IV-A pilus assembly ATPase PilB [Vibrio salilacus]|uniref:type IV-A pilus assembly ATPase PilB n=1 Tax=Vibrio salilacus TaxID=1323749 RepID=UPI000C2A5C2D|nr:type IV-A pilus assembly ATPase PilB [Vibrio salilacus]
MQSELLSLLVQLQLVSKQQQQRAQASIDELGQHPITALIEDGFISDTELAKQLAEHLALPLIQLTEFDYQALCLQFDLMPLIDRFQAVPVRLELQTLQLAVADPCQYEIENEFHFATGLVIELVITEYSALLNAIERLSQHNSARSTLTGSPAINDHQLTQLVTLSADEQREQDDLIDDKAPVSRYIQQILLDAVSRHASDIHFEPYEQSYRVRLRCDGLLISAQQPSHQLSRRLAARLKILAKLDIAERRLPQDGRIKLRLNDTVAVDMRVSTLPTLWGEKIVLRILDNRAIALTIDALGFNPEQQNIYLTALEKPQGMILLTGPTGSGKTVSLYAALNHLNSQHVNISTAEDPVEINLPGINQVHIHPEIGLDFSQTLRAFLRQDPDIIMLGEIRDLETAEIAIKAAQTGHLVLSTLHTNSAVGTITRLANMGVNHFNMASSLSLLIAQRLVRKLCRHCKQSIATPTPVAEQFNLAPNSSMFIANPAGCTHCHNGYLGRVGIYELLPINAELIEAISNQATAEQFQAIAIENGMQSLIQSGIEKVRAGVTSIDELQRVLYF